MAVDKDDRKAYEEGVEDSKRGIVESLVKFGIEVILPLNVKSDSEYAAYEKGLNGKPLDEDEDD